MKKLRNVQDKVGSRDFAHFHGCVPLLWIATEIYFYFQIRHLAVKTKTQFIFIFQAKQSYGLFRKWYQGLSKYVQGTENVVQLKGSTNYAEKIGEQYKKLKNTAKISLERDDQDFTVTYKSTNCDKELLPSRKIMFEFICYYLYFM